MKASKISLRLNDVSDLTLTVTAGLTLSPMACQLCTMSKAGYTYILANRKYGTIYVGVTSDLVARIFQHKNNVLDGFTKDHQIHRLVYYEVYDDISNAIEREKQIKNWKRAWKIKLIEEPNEEWEDLYPQIL